MFSFVGWEAGSHLAGELKDPAKQLPRAIGAAVAIVIVLYLGLAAATIGVGAQSDVPLADLMAAGLGEPGRWITALLAVLLTMGTMNTYVAAATRLAGALAHEGNAPKPLAVPKHALAAMAAISGTLLLLLAVELIDVDALMRATSALFVAVYVTATAAGNRLLTGAARVPRGRLRRRPGRVRVLGRVHPRPARDPRADRLLRQAVDLVDRAAELLERGRSERAERVAPGVEGVVEPAVVPADRDAVAGAEARPDASPWVR